ncbi:MAG: serine hydrolase [Anaerolineaceae bacterium]|nr:serine hydrolase [Anaerolineaceae bacterium]
MPFTKLEHFAYEKVAESHLPGMSIAVIKDGKVVWTRSFGFKSIEQSTAATPDSLYCIGSVSKSFTAIAIMQLVEQGKLNLTDSIDQYVPFNVKPKGENITIEQLLSHTSGIPALGFAESVIKSALGDNSQNLPAGSYEDLITFMKDAEDWVQNKPGERWYYLNEGYEMLAWIVEKCSGLPFVEYVNENILKPLGMENSSYKKEDLVTHAEFATPYIVAPEGKRIPTTYPFGLVDGAGGVVSSVNEMAKYVSMFIQRGEFEGKRLLSEELIEEMETPRIPTPHLGSPYGSYDYCLGLGTMADFHGYKLVGHSGSVGSATAYMGYVAEKKAGVVVLANGSGYSPSLIGEYALALAIDVDPDTLDFVKKEKIYKTLSGQYEGYMGTIKQRIRAAGDFLIAESSDKYDKSMTPLVPIEITEKYCTFFTLSGGRRSIVEFMIKNDEVEAIIERYAYRKVGK